MKPHRLPQLSVMATMLAMLVSGEGRLEYGPTTRNRIHTERAPSGSPLEQERKLAKRAKQR